MAEQKPNPTLGEVLSGLIRTSARTNLDLSVDVELGPGDLARCERVAAALAEEIEQRRVASAFERMSHAGEGMEVPPHLVEACLSGSLFILQPDAKDREYETLPHGRRKEAGCADQNDGGDPS